MLQGVIGQLAYGAFQWLPALLTVKLLAQGVPLALATAIGALLFPITQVGGVFGVLGGYGGDRLQRRWLRAWGCGCQYRPTCSFSGSPCHVRGRRLMRPLGGH